MSIKSKIRRSVPPLPDPHEKDLKKMNYQMIEAINYLISEIRSSTTEQRIVDLETKVQLHTDQINKLLNP